MFSISTAPAKQSVGDTITTLSGRLSSATLLEDRRAAILGLRSFAKDFPASVASGALRSLIGSLSKDGEDVDTVKVVLETLLTLFSPNEESPEASDEIALWLADEFTQRQENVTLLLDFIETNDFYSRLYSLQLLGAILSARTERTEECIFTAPLGISRLVAVLDDPREAVRNEGITLLTYLTPSSVDIQKLVAFENAFEKLFSIIAEDGSLTEGGRTVEDCLILLANLLRRNASNQALFRESGCVSKLANLLSGLLRVRNDLTADVAGWAETQRNRNVYAFLAVVRLFLGRRFAGRTQNQAAFWKHGLSFHVLQLAFNHDAEAQIRAEALMTCADMIRGNASIQESFAQLMVTSPLHVPDQAKDQANGLSQVYVIDGLLDLTLNLAELGAFDVRFAACECLQAYFAHHEDVRLHFLGRAIEGYQAHHDESANVLSVLLRSDTTTKVTDPYRMWFAAVITFHLLHNNPTAKAKALGLTEGDTESGEEVVTVVQTIAAHFFSGIRRDDDVRILVASLMLLCGWLFEDLDAVNDFLSEGSNIQSLIQIVTQSSVAGGDLVQGLCALLLGITYEFSTKDSPIPRATLHSILTSRVDKEKYADRLAKLRSHPLIRDFEVTPQRLGSSPPGELPEVFLDATFVEFLKDNYSRISRALDREPGLEISVVTNGVQKGISRELVDSLRIQVDEKEKALQEVQAALAALEGKLVQEQADHRRTKESVASEVSKAQSAAENLQRAHDAELRKLQSQLSAKDVEHQKAIARSQSQLSTKDNDHQKEIAKLKTQFSTKENEAQKEMAKLKSQISTKESEAQKEINKLKAQFSAKESDHHKELSRLKAEISAKDEDHEQQLAQVKKTVEQDAERVQRRTQAEIADLKATISRLEVDLMKANKAKTQELQALKDEHSAALAKEKKRADDAENKVKANDGKLKEADQKSKDYAEELEKAQQKTDELRTKAAETASALAAANKAKDSTQSELDDLLLVFTELEEKVSKYKNRLVELGEAVSDAEDDDEEEASGSDDDVD
ncbi:hypothetical protein NLU13_3605 [Sarocladium strictum]|uniref:Uncharacterized protein n=1 Tax=Sarocladium strictum TaxID=5046 RepID=A0AA39LAE5_SARSR|nr:hypothetical protein NLU13_3605 [Sarocladium strictum]